MRVLLMAFALGAAAPVSIELPGEFVPFADIPGGPSADAINGNCLACHSGEMVINQPKLTAAEWQGEVTKMRTAYHAPVETSDDAAIVAWLTAMQSKLQAKPPKG
ncbi:MAG: cytochrome c [Sandarakinorhabdus sp.]|nr:cytochrome c [Sandarakinorhabdus sp.]